MANLAQFQSPRPIAPLTWDEEHIIAISSMRMPIAIVWNTGKYHSILSKMQRNSTNVVAKTFTVRFESFAIMFRKFLLFLPLLTMGNAPAPDVNEVMVPSAIDNAISNSKKGKSNRYYKPLPEMITKAALLGVRSDGVYWTNENGFDQNSGETYTTYLRFCPDGLVIEAVSPQKIDHVVPWFRCDRIDHVTTYGALHVEGEQLIFIMNQRPGEYDYWGTAQNGAAAGEDTLTLYGRARSKRAKTFMQTNKYIFNFAAL